MRTDNGKCKEIAPAYKIGEKSEDFSVLIGVPWTKDRLPCPLDESWPHARPSPARAGQDRRSVTHADRLLIILRFSVNSRPIFRQLFAVFVLLALVD